MKNYLKVGLLCLSPFLISNHKTKEDIIPISITKNRLEPISQIEPKPIKSVITNTTFIAALIEVESLGNDSAIGDKHLVGNEAVGALQIRPIMMREVNRILKILKSDKRFKRKDRFDREKSIEMFMIWKNYHHPAGGFETIARNWNGGPRGYKNPRTEKYWAKVQKELHKN